MADTTVNLGACVQQTDDLDWSEQDDAVVLAGVAAGSDAALAEGRRRWPGGA